MDNQQGRLCNLSWLAAVIESEGSISYIKRLYYPQKKTHYLPSVTIVNTDADLLNACIAIMKENGIGCYVGKKRQPKSSISKKECAMVQVTGYKRIKTLLELLKPFFKSNKRFRCDKLLEIINYRLSIQRNAPFTQREEDCWKEMKLMYGTLRDYTPGSHYECEDDRVRTAFSSAEISRND